MAQLDFTKLQRAVAKNFDRIAAVAVNANDGDPDLQTYEGLTPQAFDEIAKRYGPDNLVRYIRTMETKRIKRQMKGQTYG